MIYSVETCSIGVTFSRSSRFSRETLVKSIIIPSSFYQSIPFLSSLFTPRTALSRGVSEKCVADSLVVLLVCSQNDHLARDSLTGLAPENKENIERFRRY